MSTVTLLPFTMPGGGGSLADGNYGDVTVSGGGTVIQINAEVVGLPEMTDGVPGNLISYDAAGEAVAVATGAATQVLTSNGAGLPPTFQAPAGGAAAITAVTVTAPYGVHEASIVVVDAGIAGTSKIVLSWGSALDTDENGPDMDHVAMSARPAAGSMTVRLTKTGPDGPALGGAYKLNYLVGA